MRAKKLIPSWPVLRQLRGDRLGLGAAAPSEQYGTLRPRVEDAAPLATSLCP